MRYTECTLTDAAMAMVESIDEDTVGFGANYDGQEEEPQASRRDPEPGQPPRHCRDGDQHGLQSLRGLINAARYLLKHPDASL